MSRTIRIALFTALVGVVGVGQAYAGDVKGTPPPCTSSTPTSTQALVWTNINFTGACYVLQLGNGVDLWTSWEATFGFPNDQIRSVKTGTGISLVLFWKSFYTADTGTPLGVLPNTWASDLGIWNGQASAARVQTFSPNACTGVSGRFAPFANANFGGDCTELEVGNCYPGSAEMGFRNDTLTSWINTSPNAIRLYANANYGSFMFGAAANGSSANIGLSWTDIMSSLRGSSCLQ